MQLQNVSQYHIIWPVDQDIKRKIYSELFYKFIFVVQDVQFKMQPNNHHILQYKNEIQSRSTFHVIDFSNLPLWYPSQPHPICLVAAVQKLYRCENGVCEQNVCPFLNITSHQNRMLFMKHLVIRILTTEYKIRHQYTNWTKFWEQEVFAYDRCWLSNR